MRVLELFSGVGGWALAWDGDTEPVDISTTCNDIYEHNFGRRPRQKSIESLTAADVAGFDVWLLSPPCQPHTRQHALVENDRRCAALHHLCALVAKAPPKLFVCLENVLGFEKSSACADWHRALTSLGFGIQAWHLTPTQIGVPNHRPRYYEIAVRHGPHRPDPVDAWPVPAVSSLTPISDFLVDDHGDLALTEATLSKSAAWCLDVVRPASTQPASCFTRSYGRFVRGTGSVLYVGDESLESLGIHRVHPADRTFRREWRSDALQPGHLRYFAPMEIANLLGFPRHFSFPASTSTRNQWAALGNSLHVPAAKAVIHRALRDSASATLAAAL